MKRLHRIISLITAITFFASAPAHANVALNLDVENLHGDNVNNLCPATSTVVLLVSTANASFGDLTFSNNPALADSQFTAEADDQVLGMFEVTSDGVFQNAVVFNLNAQVSVNDPLQLVWYPGLPFNAGRTGPGQAQPFGTYRSDAATAGSDIGWLVPADGSGLNLFAFSAGAGGDVPDIILVANKVTAGGAVNHPPTALCHDVTVSAAGNCQASVTAAQVDNGSSDSDGDPITLSVSPAGPYTLGTNNVTLTVADNHGGTNTCNAKVIVNDTTLPTITCPSNVSTQLAPGSATIVINFPAPTTGDNCGVKTVSISPISGTAFAIGTAIVTNIVVDTSGNTNTCTFTITVAPAPNRVPVAICQDVTVSAAANCQASVTPSQVNNGSSDPDSDPITFSLSPTGPFALGTNNVTLTVADNRGGTNTCTAKVIVRDTTLPTITCSSNVITQAAPGQTSAVVNFPAPTTGDNCGVKSVTSSPVSGSAFAVGTTTVTNTVVDNSGNTNTCTFTVTVNAPGNQTPIASCQDVTVSADANCQANVTVAQVNNGSSDPDGDPITLHLSPAGPFARGTNNVTLTVADNHGGTNTCTAKVIVRDTTLPSIACPSNISTQLAPGQASIVLNFPAPQTSDNCGIASVTSTPVSGSSFTAGTTIVTNRVIDVGDNTNTCTFSITVAPAANRAPVAVCQDVTVSAAANCQASVTASQVNNGSSDPDSDLITFSLSPTGPFALGTNNVTLTVADNRGGTNTCNATVIVRDTTLPTITCPSNISTQLAPGQASIVLTFPAPQTSDNCGVASVTSSLPSGSTFSAGTTVITNTVVDNAGNTNTCTFSIMVNPPGNQAPIAVCQNVTVSAGANCQANVTAAQVDNGSSDPDSDPITLSLSPAGPFTAGTNNVTLTVADNHGGTNTCTAKVIVLDNTPPTITCPSNIVVTVAAGVNSTIVNFPAAQASDNCGIKSVTSSPASGSSFAVGTTTVTSTVVDNAGNTNSCTFTVTINQTPNQPPTAVCQDVTVSAGANCSASVTAAQVDNGSTDSDGNITSRSLTPTSPYALGQTPVTLTVVDNLGASNTCTATITVIDTTAPSITCPANIIVDVASNETSTVVAFATPATLDNCGPVTVTTAPVSGSAFNLGATPVVCTAVDNAGNTNTCTFTVTVRAATGTCDIASLIQRVSALTIDQDRKNSLLDRLNAAQRSLTSGKVRPAFAQLNSFIKAVKKLELDSVLADCAASLIPDGGGK